VESDHSSALKIRRVRSVEELRDVFEVLGRLFTPRIERDDRRIDDLVRRYPIDRPLMLLVESSDRIIGGALGFSSTLRIIGLDPKFRGLGLGRRLLQTFEVAAMRHGVRELSLGAEEAKGFYLRLGYKGKSSMHKQFPLPGRVAELRLRKLEQLAGDLESGGAVPVEDGGRVPSLV